MRKFSLLLLSLKCLFGIISGSSNAVEKVGKDKYTMDIVEGGIKIKQTMKFDQERGLTVIQVPQHHDRSHATFIIDHKQNLTVEINHDLATCEIYQSLPYYEMHQNVLEEASTRSDTADSSPIIDAANISQNMKFDIHTITGPTIQPECIPSQFRPYTNNYTCTMTRKVRKEVYTEEDIFALSDPEIQEPINYEDDPSILVRHFDFLPSCDSTGHLKGRRTKRSCRYPDGTIVSNCFMRKAMCKPGCDAKDLAYQCHPTKRRSCYYVLVCPGGAMHDKECIFHIMNNNNGCIGPCCRRRDCGDKLPKCEDWKGNRTP